MVRVESLNLGQGRTGPINGSPQRSDLAGQDGELVVRTDIVLDDLHLPTAGDERVQIFKQIGHGRRVAEIPDGVAEGLSDGGDCVSLFL